LTEAGWLVDATRQAEKPVTVKEARHLFQKRQATLRVLHPQEFCHPMWKLCATLQEYARSLLLYGEYPAPAHDHYHAGSSAAWWAATSTSRQRIRKASHLTLMTSMCS